MKFALSVSLLDLGEEGVLSVLTLVNVEENTDDSTEKGDSLGVDAALDDMHEVNFEVVGLTVDSMLGR